MSMIIKEFDLEDVYLLSEIIDKANIPIKTEKLSEKVKTDKLESVEDLKSIGKEAFLAIAIDVTYSATRSLWKVKNLVNKFIGNMTGMKPEAVKKLGIKGIKEFFAELLNTPDFKSFLEQADQ
ncbi:MAG: hypothetical protein M0P10_06910 [Sphaerochaetaceae bacterium]|nr:hypothetical protein [Sphaerochaetaceae bacterium]